MMISNIYRDCFAQLSYEAVRDSGQPFLCFCVRINQSESPYSLAKE